MKRLVLAALVIVGVARWPLAAQQAPPPSRPFVPVTDEML